ncbi:MAG: hypothetical protein EAZ35_08995 [Sphingobacteriia bacterium]|nr:MAG: hypothetical protein EAZ35_08995 [Sphingobacteriia bacterium]
MFIHSIFLQDQTTRYILTGIVTGAVLFLFLAGIIVYFVIEYKKRQQQNRAHTITMQENFQKELLITQAEVKEQTLQTIAADLHDNIGQLLSITHATLSSINVEDKIKSSQKIQTAIGFVNHSIKDLRQLAKLLQAENLLQQGLITAIEQELDWLKNSGQYQVHFTKNMDESYLPNPKKELFIFRLLQEIINNIIKHAHASNITCTLAFKEQMLSLIISDDGNGFDAPLINKKDAGLGIGNMKKRAALIGGTFNIQSSPGNGTTVHINIPYTNE